MARKIYLYDTETECIGAGCLSSAYIQMILQEAAGADIEVHISSVGGSAFDAIATYDLLKKYEGKVTTYIDALAASAASIIAMAGQTIIMSKYALLMIHKPMIGSGGNADELLKDVNMLNVVQTRLAAIYMDKSGLDEITINSLINAVTWMTADQALDLGFVDQIEDYAVEAKPDITNSAIIRKYTNTAPALYQRCINKILLPEKTTDDMNVENKALIEKTTTVLDKIMNFFKKVVNKSTETDKGMLHHTGALDKGTEVFKDEDMTEPAADGEMEMKDDKKTKVTIKDGKVMDMEEGEPDEDDDEIDAENRVVLNKLNIVVANKATTNDAVKAIMPKLAELQNTVNSQNELIITAKAQLEANKVELDKTREEIKNEIKTNFTPEGSKRSSKAKTEALPSFMPAKGTTAYNALQKAKANHQK